MSHHSTQFEFSYVLQSASSLSFHNFPDLLVAPRSTMEVRRTKLLMTYVRVTFIRKPISMLSPKPANLAYMLRFLLSVPAEVFKSFLSPSHNFDNLDHCPLFLPMPFHGQLRPPEARLFCG